MKVVSLILILVASGTSWGQEERGLVEGQLSISPAEADSSILLDSRGAIATLQGAIPKEELLANHERLIERYEEEVAQARLVYDAQTNPQPSLVTPYQWAYEVNAPSTGDQKSQVERREEDGIVRGRYSVVDPDGFLRTVTYMAHPDDGFQATVDKQVAIQDSLDSQSSSLLTYGLQQGDYKSQGQQSRRQQQYQSEQSRYQGNRQLLGSQQYSNEQSLLNQRQEYREQRPLEYRAQQSLSNQQQQSQQYRDQQNQFSQQQRQQQYIDQQYRDQRNDRREQYGNRQQQSQSYSGRRYDSRQTQQIQNYKANQQQQQQQQQQQYRNVQQQDYSSRQQQQQRYTNREQEQRQQQQYTRRQNQEQIKQRQYYDEEQRQYNNEERSGLLQQRYPQQQQQYTNQRQQYSEQSHSSLDQKTQLNSQRQDAQRYSSGDQLNTRYSDVHFEVHNQRYGDQPVHLFQKNQGEYNVVPIILRRVRDTEVKEE